MFTQSHTCCADEGTCEHKINANQKTIALAWSNIMFGLSKHMHRDTGLYGVGTKASNIKS